MDSDLIQQRMRELAAKIEAEQDREKVLALTKELNQLLDQRKNQEARKSS
jgi:hypothetical protein